MTEQRRERLRTAWCYAGAVAGLLVYLFASQVTFLGPLTAMVTPVQVLWMLFGVGMFLQALWGTEERSWIPKAGGLIVAVGVIAAWEIGVVWPLKDWKILANDQLQYVPAMGRVVRFLLIWVYARRLHARSGSYLLSWWVPCALTFGMIEWSRAEDILRMPGFDRQLREDSLDRLICTYTVRGLSFIAIAAVVECLYNRFRGFGEGKRPDAGSSSLLLPVLIATGPIWLVHELISARSSPGEVSAVRMWGGSLPRVVFPKETVSVACLCIGLIAAWLATPSGANWRGFSARFLVSLGAAFSCFFFVVYLTGSEVSWVLAWILVGVFGLGMLADQPRPGSGFQPSDESRACVRSLCGHFSSPLAHWRMRGIQRFDWLMGPAVFAALLLGSYATAQLVGGSMSPYRWERMMANREALGDFLFLMKWIVVFVMVLVPVPLILWLLCQRLGAMWGRDQLEQLKVTPMSNWDIWWGLTIPGVRSPVFLMIYGTLFSALLALIARQPPPNRWAAFSWDDYRIQFCLAMAPLSLLIAWSLLVVSVRSSKMAGPLVFARVVTVTVLLVVLLILCVWVPWAWGFESAVGPYLQRVMLFVVLAYLPYLALRGVPKDIDALFDESVRS